MCHALDIKDISGYPNKPPPKYDKNQPRFNDDSCCAIPHILSLARHASTFKGRQDLLIRTFLLLLGKRQRGWVKHSCKPKGIPSLRVFVEEFLKHWGPHSQSFEDTYQDLLTTLEEEGLRGLFEGNEEIDEDFLDKEDSHGDDSVDIIKNSEDCMLMLQFVMPLPLKKKS